MVAQNTTILLSTIREALKQLSAPWIIDDLFLNQRKIRINSIQRTCFLSQEII